MESTQSIRALNLILGLQKQVHRRVYFTEKDSGDTGHHYIGDIIEALYSDGLEIKFQHIMLL